MGSMCSSVTEEDKQNGLVDDEITISRRRDQKMKKLLLLGAGGSGKSTFFKQLQTIHGRGFSDKDRISFRNHVFHQIIEQMKRMISRGEEYSDEYPQEFSDYKISSECVEHAEYVQMLRDDAPVTPEIAAQIECLWKDDAIRRIYDKRARFGITDSTAYFFNEIRRIASPNYIPTFEVKKIKYKYLKILKNKSYENH